MQILYYIFITFAAIAALDRIFGSKLGLGTEFERGVSMAGPLVLAMGGMLVLVPVISELLSGIAGASGIFFDFSVIYKKLNNLRSKPLDIHSPLGGKMNETALKLSGASGIEATDSARSLLLAIVKQLLSAGGASFGEGEHLLRSVALCGNA